MTYYIGVVLLLVVFGYILFAAYYKKKGKNGVFQTITKDVEKDKIIVKTEVIVNDEIFDSFEDVVTTLDEALKSKKLAKTNGNAIYKTAKKLMKK